MTSLLNVQAKVFITIGTVLAIAAAYAGTGEIRSRLGTLRDTIGRRLQQPGWRAAASLAAIAVGFLAMRWPEATTSIAIRTAAFLGFVAGAIGLLDVLGSVDWAREGPIPLQRTARRLAIGVTGAITVVTVTMLFGGLAFARALRAPSTDQPEISETGCNGSHDLCDLTLAEVVLPGTHNSMAASADDFFGARQTASVGAQLASGVRAFMLDLHYGVDRDAVRAHRLPQPGRRGRGESSSTPSIVPSPRVSRRTSARRPTSGRCTCATSTASWAPPAPSTRSVSSTTTSGRTPTRSSC